MKVHPLHEELAAVVDAASIEWGASLEPWQRDQLEARFELLLRERLGLPLVPPAPRLPDPGRGMEGRA